MYVDIKLLPLVLYIYIYAFIKDHHHHISDEKVLHLTTHLEGNKSFVDDHNSLIDHLNATNNGQEPSYSSLDPYPVEDFNTSSAKHHHVRKTWTTATFQQTYLTGRYVKLSRVSKSSDSTAQYLIHILGIDVYDVNGIFISNQSTPSMSSVWFDAPRTAIFDRWDPSRINKQ